MIGALDLDPEPTGPAPAAISCFKCRRTDAACPVSAGAGPAALAAQATALVAAAETDRLAA
jgi:hypothetical protein